jgi:hypothetical protein
MEADSMTDKALARELLQQLTKARSTAERISILAENTDLSPRQAKGLLFYCGDDLAALARQATIYKAEG